MRTIIKKFFFVWDFDKEEKWLNEMAAKGLALVGVIIGEFLAAKAGLGYLIIYASQVFKLDIVISSIFLLCVISVLLYHGIARLEKK